MQRRVWRGLRTVLMVAMLVAVTAGCSYTVGCRTYTLLGPPFEVTVDEAACAPPAVVPEVPTVLLLPLAGIAMLLLGRRLIRDRRGSMV